MRELISLCVHSCNALSYNRRMDRGSNCITSRIRNAMGSMIRPSLETLSNTADEKKTGGVFAGQRAGCLILDVSSNEEVGRFLGSLPFFSRLKWNVIPLQSYRSAIGRDSKALGGKG